MIIGLSGKSNSGKDTAADFLASTGFVKISFADEIKRIAMKLFGFDSEQLWGSSARRNEPPPGKGKPIARDVLQKFGTEFGRNFDENVWIDKLVNNIETLAEGVPRHWDCHFEYTPEKGISELEGWKPAATAFVISDVRFENEIAAIKTRLNGRVFRVVRHDSGLEGDYANHASEVEMDNIPDKSFDAVIRNDTCLSTLKHKILFYAGV